MDWKAVTRLFKDFHQPVKRRLVIGFAVGVILFPTLSTHLFFWRIEHGLNLKIHRKPLFVLLPGFIHLDPVSLEWAGRLYVRSGSLEVRFPWTGMLPSRLPISFEGRNLAIQAGPELSKALGKNEVIFDRVSAKILVNSRRAIDLEFLDAESKTIQFHLSNSPKDSGKTHAHA